MAHFWRMNFSVDQNNERYHLGALVGTSVKVRTSKQFIEKEVDKPF